MKKKSFLLASIVMSSLSVLPLCIIKFDNKVKNVYDKSESILNSDKISSDVNYSDLSYSYNPAYPKQTLTYNQGAVTIANIVYYETNRSVDYASNTPVDIYFKNYAASKSAFLKYYKTMNINFYFEAAVGAWRNNWTEAQKFIFRTITIDSSALNNNWKVLWISSKADSNDNSGETAYKKWNSNSGKVITKLEGKLDNDKIQFRFNNNHYAFISGNFTIWNYHLSYINSITMNSSFNIETLKNTVNNSLKQRFSFESDTSPDLTSTEKNGILGGGIKNSNKEIIDNEVSSRLKKAFGSDYEMWFGGTNPILKKTESYNNSSSVYSLTLKDSGSGSFNTQFVLNVTMPVTITLSDYYYQRAAQKRLMVTPGLIVDPTSVEPKMIDDKPEFDPKTNTFTYHNSVSVQYIEDKENQNKEKVYLNGNEQQMYNGISRFEIVDDREDGTASEVVHKISVSGLKGDDLEVNIVIKSLSTNISWKWLGWDPSINQNQANLIEKKLPNGETNPNYDPTIDEKTGMRNQYIFVNASLNDKYNYPFYVDPLDKYGILIRDKDSDKMDKLLNGYIAEAYVANSGVIPISGYDSSKAAKIERVKLDYETFEPISTPQTVDPTKQETYEGLYHYIIYLKDYVEKSISPSDPITPSTPSYTAKQGSTLHKLVYISNKVDSYAQFTNIFKINQSNKFSEFWSSIPGKHLKNYLVKEKMFDTEKIQSLTYEQLILYWKQYVSDQKQQLVDPPLDPVDYKNLQNLEISSLKVNTTDKNTVIDRINKYVEDKMSIFSSTAKLDIDYEILVVQNSLETSLKNFDYSDFLNNSAAVTKIDIKIKSKTESKLLNGYQNFTTINNKDYDETKMLDLSEISVNPLSFNFSSSNIESDVFLENYIYDYTRQIIELYRPEDVDYEYIYGEDYYISLDGLKGEEIKNQKDLSEVINRFLNSSVDVELRITIISTDESIKLTGYTSYIIQNLPDSDNIAPEKPEPPTKPFDPDKGNDNQGNAGNSSSEFVKANLWWIITVILLTVPAIGVPIWMKMRNKKTKIK